MQFVLIVVMYDTPLVRHTRCCCGSLPRPCCSPVSHTQAELGVLLECVCSLIDGRCLARAIPFREYITAVPFASTVFKTDRSIKYELFDKMKMRFDVAQCFLQPAGWHSSVRNCIEAVCEMVCCVAVLLYPFTPSSDDAWIFFRTCVCEHRHSASVVFYAGCEHLQIHNFLCTRGCGYVFCFSSRPSRTSLRFARPADWRVT